MKYYNMWGKRTSVGNIVVDNPERIFDLAEYLDGKYEFPNKMFLRKSKIKKGKMVFEDFDNAGNEELWTDRLGTTLAVPLFSEKLKGLVEQNLGEKDSVEWIKVYVGYREETVEYYMARFTKFADVLNFEKTMYVEGTDVVIVPCLSQEKTTGHNFFTTNEDWIIPTGICVSDKLRKIIKTEKCTGMSFSPIKSD